MKDKIIIIAEAGVNHNGDLNIAKKMIEVAADAKADYVKFQTFKSEKVVSVFARKADYQKQNLPSENDSQIEMIRKYELDEKAHEELIKHSKKCHIKMLSTAFDLDSIDLLKKLNLDYWKIPSGEITNLPYLRKIGAYNQKVILSTGMSTLSEVETALNILMKAGTSKQNITILHCNTQYPTPFCDVNLKAMQTMKDAFNVNVGYSDHTIGIEVPIAAVAMGATIIEKHFTLDKNMEGPDHKASLEPDELKRMIVSIRNIEKALGDRVKQLTSSEAENVKIARKSIVAATDIKFGDVYTESNITIKRPGYGISPLSWDLMLGQKANRDYKKDELIEK